MCVCDIVVFVVCLCFLFYVHVCVARCVAHVELVVLRACCVYTCFVCCRLAPVSCVCLMLWCGVVVCLCCLFVLLLFCLVWRVIVFFMCVVCCCLICLFLLLF